MDYLLCYFLIGILLVLIGAFVASNIESRAQKALRIQTDQLIEGKKQTTQQEINRLIDGLSKGPTREDKKRISKLRELLWKNSLK